MLEISQVDNIKTVTLSRPPVNALSPEWIRQFSQLLEDLRSDSTVSVVHLRSSQRVFSAGFDLTTFHGNFRNPNGREAAMDVVQSLQDVCRRLENLEKVTVAELSGAAMGGGLELALSCDMRVAANDARLALPETQLGLLPGAGGTQRLRRLCGSGVARQLIFTGRPVTGAEAKELGIVNFAIDAGLIQDWTADFVKSLGRTPNATIAAAKRCLLAADRNDGSGFSLELDGSRQLYSNPETRERIEAFLTARKRK